MGSVKVYQHLTKTRFASAISVNYRTNPALKSDHQKDRWMTRRYPPAKVKAATKRISTIGRPIPRFLVTERVDPGPNDPPGHPRGGRENGDARAIRIGDYGHRAPLFDRLAFDPAGGLDHLGHDPDGPLNTDRANAHDNGGILINQMVLGQGDMLEVAVDDQEDEHRCAAPRRQRPPPDADGHWESPNDV